MLISQQLLSLVKGWIMFWNLCFSDALYGKTLKEQSGMHSAEVIDPPSSEDMIDIVGHVMDPPQTTVKLSLTVLSSAHELLECLVCLTAMYHCAT